MSRVTERTRGRTGELPKGPGGLVRKGAAGRGTGGPGAGGTGMGGLGKAGMVGGVLLAVLAGWYAAPLVYPLRLLTVLLHEGGHALVTVLTGGTVLEMAVNAEESGHTLSSGGFHFLILQGGYLGSLLAGLALTAVPRAARGVCVLLALAAGVALAYIPVVSFGFVYTAIVAVGLATLAVKTSHQTCRFVLRALGLFVVADAVRDILSDLGRGDAAILAQLTGVPALVWSAAWLIGAIAILVHAVRRA